MDLDAIQKLIQRRDRGDLSDIEYIDQSRRLIEQMPTRNAEDQAEKGAMLAYMISLRERAVYWEQKEIESLAGEVEQWLCEPSAN